MAGLNTANNYRRLTFSCGGDEMSRAVVEWYDSQPDGSRALKIREAIYTQYVSRSLNENLLDELRIIRQEMTAMRQELGRLKAGAPPDEEGKVATMSGKTFVDSFEF